MSAVSAARCGSPLPATLRCPYRWAPTAPAPMLLAVLIVVTLVLPVALVWPAPPHVVLAVSFGLTFAVRFSARRWVAGSCARCACGRCANRVSGRVDARSGVSYSEYLDRYARRGRLGSDAGTDLVCVLAAAPARHTRPLREFVPPRYDVADDNRWRWMFVRDLRDAAPLIVSGRAGAAARVLAAADAEHRNDCVAEGTLDPGENGCQVDVSVPLPPVTAELVVELLRRLPLPDAVVAAQAATAAPADAASRTP